MLLIEAIQYLKFRHKFRQGIYLIDFKQKPLRKRSDEISFLTTFNREEKYVNDSDKRTDSPSNGPQAR